MKLENIRDVPHHPRTAILFIAIFQLVRRGIYLYRILSLLFGRRRYLTNISC